MTCPTFMLSSWHVQPLCYHHDMFNLYVITMTCPAFMLSSWHVQLGEESMLNFISAIVPFSPTASSQNSGILGRRSCCNSTSWEDVCKKLHLTCYSICIYQHISSYNCYISMLFEFDINNKDHLISAFIG
jgi:hypothetical protein